MKFLDDVDLKGKRVLMRVDFNVPLDKNRQVTDDKRIQAVVPSLHELLEEQCRVVLASHLGRPKGKVVAEMSLQSVADSLSGLIGRPVTVAPDCIGLEVTRLMEALQPGQVLLLENLRFHPEEEQNDPGFAQALASLCDVYVNEGFAVSHRAHASVDGITSYANPSDERLREKRDLGAKLGDRNSPCGSLVNLARPHRVITRESPRSRKSLPQLVLGTRTGRRLWASAFSITPRSPDFATGQTA